jgi:hypothetical protein
MGLKRRWKDNIVFGQGEWGENETGPFSCLTSSYDINSILPSWLSSHYWQTDSLVNQRIMSVETAVLLSKTYAFLFAVDQLRIRSTAHEKKKTQGSLHSYRNPSLDCMPSCSSPFCTFSHTRIPLGPLCRMILKVTLMPFKWALPALVYKRNSIWFFSPLKCILPISIYSILVGSVVTTAWRVIELCMEVWTPAMHGSCEYIE